MTRPRGFLYDWQPREGTKALIDAMQDVLGEYASQLPLTLRQVYYRLVAKGILGKTDKEYKRLCETANRARRAQLISFQDIRDDGFTFRESASFEDADDFWDQIVSGPRISN